MLEMLLAFAVMRGEHIPQGELPFLDALPLDMKDREAVIGAYTGRVKDGDQDSCCQWWMYRQATRLYLRDLPPMQAAYMLGRLQGRQWAWYQRQTQENVWITKWWDIPYKE